MDTRRAHVIVRGRVQGVFFRAYTQMEAQRLGLRGWVRNRPDGSVESLIEGEKEAVDQMLQWFHRGSPLSMVSGVTVTAEEPIGEHQDFAIHSY